MDINWDVTIRFDPNSVLASTQHGIPVPSYGNYGGPNYSAGDEGGRTPEFGTADYLAHPPQRTISISCFIRTISSISIWKMALQPYSRLSMQTRSC
jgi:hypothetical protein